MNFNEMMLLSKEISLVLFFLFFVGVLYWAFRPGNRKRFEDAGRMILKDDDVNEPQEKTPPPSPR